MIDASTLRIKIFADGADLDSMMPLYANPLIKGFTTNPTLMRKAGVRTYRAFALEILREITDRPISFEVMSDDFDEMERQGHEIASWGKNVNVKIPVTNTRGEFAGPVIERLSMAGIVVNVTALMTLEQVDAVTRCLSAGTSALISVFSGRIADTGRDPVPFMREALSIAAARPLAELIWASPRELLNIFQADAVGCHIITATNDILEKLPLIGKDLTTYSRETVAMFFADALAAGYVVDGPKAAEKVAWERHKACNREGGGI